MRGHLLSLDLLAQTLGQVRLPRRVALVLMPVPAEGDVTAATGFLRADAIAAVAATGVLPADAIAATDINHVFSRSFF
jgi:hypothetical protein